MAKKTGGKKTKFVRGMKEIPSCVPKEVKSHLKLLAANHAIKINPSNRPDVGKLFETPTFKSLMAMVPPTVSGVDPMEKAEPDFLAIQTTKYWGVEGVRLDVSFMQ